MIVKDKHFKIKLNSSESFKPKFEKTSSNFENFKADLNGSSPQDIYLDEIIYYDGGGVEGYGNES